MAPFRGFFISIKITSLLFLLIFLFPVLIFGQGLDEKLNDIKSLDGSFITEYLSPLSEYFGIASSASVSNNSQSVSFPHFRLGISYAHLKIRERDKYFFYNGDRYETLFGQNTDSVSGLNLNNLSIPVAQLNLGLGDEFELIGRYINFKESKLGKIEIAGIGVKYELEDFFNIPAFPLDMNILALYQKMEIGNNIEGAIFQMGLSASKVFSNLGLFVGLNYVNNTLNYEVDENTVYAINGLDQILYHGGLFYRIRFLQLATEYNFNYSYFSFNISVIF